MLMPVHRRLHRLSTALGLLLAFLLLNGVSSVQAYERNPFGVIEGFWLPEEVCELGAGWERIIFDWAQHQPTSGEDWYTLNVDDRWLAAARECNREVVAIIKHTPQWATDGMAGPGVPHGLYLPVDDPGNLWANFMRRAAEYYAERGVRRFIIWNEPDISRDTYGFEYEGTLEDYAQLLKVAYLAAKQGNPARISTSPGQRTGTMSMRGSGSTWIVCSNASRLTPMPRRIATISTPCHAAHLLPHRNGLPDCQRDARTARPLWLERQAYLDRRDQRFAQPRSALAGAAPQLADHARPAGGVSRAGGGARLGGRRGSYGRVQAVRSGRCRPARSRSAFCARMGAASRLRDVEHGHQPFQRCDGRHLHPF